jgi:hypothetical protein
VKDLGSDAGNPKAQTLAALKFRHWKRSSSDTGSPRDQRLAALRFRHSKPYSSDTGSPRVQTLEALKLRHWKPGIADAKSLTTHLSKRLMAHIALGEGITLPLLTYLSYEQQASHTWGAEKSYLY